MRNNRLWDSLRINWMKFPRQWLNQHPRETHRSWKLTSPVSHSSSQLRTASKPLMSVWQQGLESLLKNSFSLKITKPQTLIEVCSHPVVHPANLKTVYNHIEWWTLRRSLRLTINPMISNKPPTSHPGVSALVLLIDPSLIHQLFKTKEVPHRRKVPNNPTSI